LIKKHIVLAESIGPRSMCQYPDVLSTIWQGAKIQDRFPPGIPAVNGATQLLTPPDLQRHL
jgi:hypothetical protein